MRRALVLLFALAPTLAAADRAPIGCRKRARIEGRELSAEAAERLRLLPSTARGPHAGEFRLRDGRVLVQPTLGGPATLYALAAYQALKAALTSEQRLRKVGDNEAFHALRGYLDDGDTFGAQAEGLAAQLSRRLEREGLAVADAGVDALATRWRASSCGADPQLFRELTAWLGERARAMAAPAIWTTRTNDGVVEPLVEGSYKGQARATAPWELAALLLNEDGATVAALLDEALTAVAPAPPAADPAPAPGLDGVRPSPAAPAALSTAAPQSGPAAAAVADPGLQTH